jgi:small conductance mechanosensitive channel
MVTVLNELGVNVRAVAHRCGYRGIALGFGAQWLIKDLLNGFCLILEDQVRVGDDATINGTDGLVEQINLRTIVLRDVRGTVHVFANGAHHHPGEPEQGLLSLRHRSEHLYKEDPDRVSEIVREVDREHAPESRVRGASCSSPYRYTA